MSNNIIYLINSPRKIFILLSVCLGLFMLAASRDYGLIEDAQQHNDHGRILLEFFHGKNNRAAESPFMENGKPIEGGNGATYEQDAMRGMNFFGGFFDLTANFLHDEIFPSTGIFEFRNYLNAIFGFLCMLFCGLVAKELGNWKTGILALIFVILTPLLFGHSMNNPKDIPTATFYIIAIYLILKFVKNLPKINILQVIFLVLSISIAINIRVSGILLCGFFLLYIFVQWLSEAQKYKFSKNQFIKGSVLFSKAIGITIIAYLSSCIFWPYAQTNPLLVPFKVLTFVSDFPFNPFQLFEGKWTNVSDIPWYFAPKWLLITAPLHIIIGTLAIPLIFVPKINNYKRKEMIAFIFVFLTFLLPLIYIVLIHAKLYDNCRHLLFVLPPLISCTAVVIERIASSQLNTKIRITIYTIIGLILLQPMVWMIKYHPLESLYFSPLIGGNKGAFKKYEMDYWGFSVKPAIDWLAENADNATPIKPARVRMWYGLQLKASYYLDKHSHLKYVLVDADSPDWDYSIVLPAEAKYNNALLMKWPPENTVHQIMAGGSPVCAIVKNKFHKPSNDPSFLEQQLTANPSLTGFINLSIIYYNKGDFINCILSCQKALKLDPVNPVIYNNICSAYNSIQMFDEAKITGEKAIELKPDFELAKNNLKIALNGIKANKSKKHTVTEFIGLSFNYFRLGYYEKCLNACNEILKMDKNNATAYNNICSAYNAMGKFQEAIKACNKAIEINPNFDLAKNNLTFAKNSIKK